MALQPLGSLQSGLKPYRYDDRHPPAASSASSKAWRGSGVLGINAHELGTGSAVMLFCDGKVDEFIKPGAGAG